MDMSCYGLVPPRPSTLSVMHTAYPTVLRANNLNRTKLYKSKSIRETLEASTSNNPAKPFSYEVTKESSNFSRFFLTSP